MPRVRGPQNEKANAESAQIPKYVNGKNLTVNDTTNTSASTEPSAKRTAIPSAADLDMRDYFAAKAMQGFAADPRMGSLGSAAIAALAYSWADAMIKAREGGAA